MKMKRKKSTHSIKQSKKNLNFKNFNSCSICFLEFEEEEKVKMITRCRHIFHSKCLHKWLSTKFKCPLCNQDLRIKSSAFKNLMRIAKMNSSGDLDSHNERALEDMLSRDSKGNSYSVEVDVSQILDHDIDSSVHYASNHSSSLIRSENDQKSESGSGSEKEEEGSEKQSSLKFTTSVVFSKKKENSSNKYFLSEKNDDDLDLGSSKVKGSMKFSVTHSKKSNIKNKGFRVSYPINSIKEDPSEFNKSKEEEEKDTNRKFTIVKVKSKENLNMSKTESEKKFNTASIDSKSEKIFKTMNNDRKYSFDEKERINTKYEDNVNRVLKKGRSISIHDYEEEDEVDEGSDTVYLFRNPNEENDFLNMSQDTEKKGKDGTKRKRKMSEGGGK